MSDKAKAYAVSKVCKQTERFTAGPSGQYYALMIERITEITLTLYINLQLCK